jgi:hypothetical protein
LLQQSHLPHITFLSLEPVVKQLDSLGEQALPYLGRYNASD